MCRAFFSGREKIRKNEEIGAGGLLRRLKSFGKGSSGKAGIKRGGDGVISPPKKSESRRGEKKAKKISACVEK